MNKVGLRLAVVLAGLGLVGGAVGAGVDAQRLIARAQKERGAYGRAVRLADEVGARLAGTPAAAELSIATAWMVRHWQSTRLQPVQRA